MPVHSTTRKLHVRITLRLLLALLPLGPTAHAADAALQPNNQPIPASAFFSRPALEQAALSPSGRWLAALAPHAAGRNSLVIFDLDGKDKPRVLVRFTDIDIDGFSWVNDQRLLFGLHDRDEPRGLYRKIGGTWAVARDGNEHPTYVAGEQYWVIGAPNDGSDDVVVAMAQHDNSGEFKTLTAFRLNTVTGQMRSLSLGMPAHISSMWLDATGAPRLLTADRAGRTTVWWRGPGDQTDGWQQLAQFDNETAAWWPRQVSTDGELYVVRPSGAAGADELVRYDFARKQPEPTPLVSTPGFDFNGSIVSESVGSRALGVRTVTDAETTVWFDPQLKALQADVDRRLPGRVNRLSCKRCGTPQMTVLVHSYADREPGEYWVWRQGAVLGGANFQLLARTRPAIDSSRMATLDLHRIIARDGHDLPVWVTQPAGAKPGDGGKRPAVVLVHGGPWQRGTQWEWNAYAQFLASRGYVVIEPEFRGSEGYGRQHFMAGFRQWGQAMQDDVADATLWAARNAGVDGDRVCIAGASYGGYSALMGLARDPQLYRCGVAWVAITEPRLMFKWSYASDLGEDWREYGLPVRLGDPVQDAAMLEAVSPVTQAARIKAPLLLAFGSEDRRVPLEHGKLLRAALQDAGHPPTWVLYEGEGHSWQKPDTHIDFAQRMERFLVQHLR